MPLSKDALRVAKGLSLVLDSYVARNKDGVVTRARRATYHINELLKIAITPNTETQTSPPPTTENITPPTPSSAQPQQTNSSSSSSASSPASFSTSHSYSPPPTSSSISPQNVSSTSSSSTLTASTSFPPLLPPLQPLSVQMQVSDSSFAINSPVTSSNDIRYFDKQQDLIGFNSIKFDESMPTLSKASSGGSESGNENINTSKVVMHERAVPSSQLARMWGFGSLAARMVFGAVIDNAARVIAPSSIASSSSGSGGDKNVSRHYISDQNAERLAETLCRMRGAALKLGQMLSVQDDGFLPPALAKALDRVKQAADYMPMRQLESQLVGQLGPDWRSKFLEFDKIPLAAASIGQVF